MYRISELAEQVGLSRTALLYYEKQGLIKGRRQSNGYRIYSDHDVQRLRLVQNLLAGGLTLKECKACLDARIDRSLLQNRLQQLDDEIQRKQASRQLLAALLGEGDLSGWHQSVDSVAPDAHREWLVRQGFAEKEALRLKWLSKDMNEHEQYMADFMTVFATLDRWGPGSEADTLKALAMVPHAPKKILEIGCGKGIATTLLGEHTSAAITAVDNEESALLRLSERALEAGLADRIETVCTSMTDMPFAPESFDLIWCESSAYIMGVENAFTAWHSLLQPGGILVLSDLVWLTDAPTEECKTFWESGYPDMGTVEQRLSQARSAGYQLVDTFAVSEDAWHAYYQPLAQRVEEIRPERKHSQALKDLDKELAIYRNHLPEFGYQMFILKK
ncbi:MerR family transcriptional regulator [Parendozoicomonas haliclonae]|uniref:Demethylrebeccamycin-D-glucose O-methyltransferase n=1 Tax=Parendozoicomonas haliclonae TaxID=1960125 RepID=A0A1X7AQN8_9GAMM|nr:MerR family transcriptional regulator [Parendozoicomonas haliclonae]SMA50616.1 Demethylrebeccamycin-D-glucose O-methyltransferase [Parendozoicomonas haliclonae]